MDVLFLLCNYPVQFWHLAEAMGRKPSNRVVFLTNRSDEKQLLSAGWRRKIAKSLVKSVNGFFSSSQQARMTQ